MPNTMNKEDAKNYIKKQSPAAFLDMDKQRRGFVCPFCNNGTGKSGDGIKRIPGSDLYKCFSCDEAADIFKLIGAKFQISNFNDQFNKAIELYDIQIDKSQGSSTSVREVTPTTYESTPKKPLADVTPYIEECYKAVKDTSYYKDRGISEELIDRFHLGYDAHCNEGLPRDTFWKAAVIPLSSTCYEIRNTDVAPNDPENSSNKYRKHGPVTLFNGIALRTEKEKPIVICEGAFDAISIIQSGGQAIGLGSAANYKTLLSILDKITIAKPLILCLDNDKTGEKDQTALIEGLKKRSMPYITAPELIEGFHDVNDRLLKDAEGLKKAVSEAEEKAYSLKSPQEMAKENYLNSSAAQSISGFKSMIMESATKPRLSTGFPSIDKALDGGLYTGLYIIGAISSLGKTTLALQTADNLAKQGRDVLFFTLEQSKYDLMSKSISRETFVICRERDLDNKNALTNLGISDGRRWEKYNDTQKDVRGAAFDRYADYSNHLFIYEGIGNIPVSFIREKVRDHISYTGNKRPIVFIDYLQILAPAENDSKSSDKQIVDHNVTALKQMSRDYDIPIFAVSSLNRENYSTEINMSAFKESGAIEYGSDVLIGLQLKGAGGGKDFDVNAAKEKDPREVEYFILKNRNGRITSNGIEMHYYPKFNYFECVLDKDYKTTITPEQEDRIPADIKPLFDPDKLVFFDIEVFPNLFLVNYKVQGDNKLMSMRNPTAEQIHDLCTAKLVGFNCRKYDNHLLYGRMQGLDNDGLYKLSQKIISGDRKAFYGPAYNLSYTDVLDFATEKMSLKKWEIKLGLHHQELDLPWNQPVPENMWDKVADYCANDVIATEKVFDHCKGDFTARLILSELAGMTPNDTTNTLTQHIIFGEDKHPQNQFNYRDLSKISGDGMPRFEGYEFTKDADDKPISMYKGVEVGEGGYVWAKPGMYHNVVTFDVASMHPSSIIAENLFGDNYTQRFAELLEARLCIKHKDFEKAKTLLNGVLGKYLEDESLAKSLSQALKIAINSVYGMTCASYDNPFRDPRNVDNIVAKRGALFMINLQEEVEKMGGEVIHIKTDSIKIVDPSPEISDFIMDYGKKYGYNFEIEHVFSKICLVNKAVYVGQLSETDPEAPGTWTATGTQFQVPYVFKTLFTGEEITIDDMTETKSVKSTIYLDMNESLPEGEHDYQFVGKVGAFCPIKPGCGGGVLVRDNEKGGYSAVTGTKVKGSKGEVYRWLEIEQVKNFGKESDIDTRIFEMMADDAVKAIAEYGDVQEFIPHVPIA